MAGRGDSPRILLIDIETFPMLFYAWQSWDASALRVVENTSIASFSAKWLGGKQITRALPDYPGYKPHSRDDKKLLQELWHLLDEAHEVVAHNGKRFDVKKLNYRFILHRLGIPSPYRITDTLAEVKKVSAWDSHRLNELCRLLDVGQKVRTGGADLWFDCLEGDMKAWKLMKKYNAKDVAPLLEGLYMEVRPWIKTGSNYGMWRVGLVCPRCGSENLRGGGPTRNKTTQYHRYMCKDCGGWAQTVVNEYTGDKPLVAV